MAHSVAALQEDGWRLLRAGGFSSSIGQLLFRTEGDQLRVGFIADGDIGNEHENSVHGGALMTFADMAFGFAASRASESQAFVTLQMQYQFVHMAFIGEFLTCAPEVVRTSKQLLFTRGLICADGRTVGSVDAIFKKLAPDKYRPAPG